MRARLLISIIASIYSLCLAQNNDGWFIQNISTDLTSVFFTSPNNGWAVGNNGVILNTTDGGANWDFRNNIQTDSMSRGFDDCRSIQFIDNSTGWIIKTSGIILKTVNGGFTWDVLKIDSIFNASSVIFSSSFVDTSVGYVTSPIGLFKTTDGGKSWTKKANIFNIIFYEVYFSDHLEGWGVGADGEILHTTNGGDNWLPQTSTIIEDIIGIDFSTSQPGTGLAISDRGAVIKTTDFGNTWIQLDSITSAFCTDIKFLKNSSIAYITGLSGTIFKTTDAGETFTKQVSPGQSADYLSINVFSETLAWAVGEETTIVSTTDGGDLWSLQERTIRAGFSFSSINDIEFANSQIGIAIGDRGQGYRTTNAGNTWQHFDTEEFNDLTDLFIFPSNRSSGWIAGDFRVLLFTTDAGETWTKINPSGLEINFTFAISFRNSSEGIISGRTSFGARGLLYKTTDGGDNWTQVYRDSTNAFNDLWNINSSTYLAAGNAGTILRSTNRGDDWDLINSGTTESIAALHFINSDIGWALGSTVLLKTTDSGITWSPINIDPGINPFDLHFNSESTGYLAGRKSDFSNKGTIFKTTNGGITWEEQYVPLSISFVSSVYFLVEDIGWAGGENGAIFKTFTGGLVDVSEEMDEGDLTAAQYKLFQNYPNPFNPATKIQYSIPAMSYVTLKIYDVLGKEIATLVDGQKPAGSYETEFYVSNLASGIYFYSLNAGSYFQVKKMLLPK